MLDAHYNGEAVRSSFDRCVQACSRTVKVFIEEVGVNVECHRRLSVPEHPLDRLHVRAGTDGQARGCVAQIVRCDRWECLVGFLARGVGRTVPPTELVHVS
jgi:hypothetical protein